MSAPPSVMLIIADDWSPIAGCYGHEWIRTPRIDALAQRATMFDHAFCTTPSCAAGRAAILTGQLPQTHGLVGYRDGIECDAPTLPGVLHEHGYQTVHIGRDMHQFPRDKTHGFERMECW